MNKKKVLIGVISISVIAIFAITLSLTLFKSDANNEIYQAKTKEKIENQVGGFLTLMLETEAGSGQYQESTSGTWPGDDYEFNGTLSACQNGGELSWDSSTNSVKLLANSSDACYVYFDKKVTLASVCNPDENLSECIINYYNATGDMDNGLYYHTSSLANSAGDNSYRYAGANPNNYVCFGDDCSSEDNLYRIIGIFDDEVKLIKNTSIGDYYWIGSSSNTNNNTWSSSTLNTNTLNGTYLAGLDNNSWSSMITTNAWKVEGLSEANGESTPQIAYNYEVGSNSSSTTYSAKIGLMYVSDYGYAASSAYWSTNLESYNSAIDNNWMYIGDLEWTISRVSNTLSNVFFVYSDAGIYYFGIPALNEFAIRPVFYLKENVTYVTGDGSKENPIQIDYKQTLAEYVISQYTGTDGDNGLYYHDADLENGAGDNSYRYTGANPNNYVCFGSDASTCPSDNLYRIIGVFDGEVKLIKNISYGRYRWSGSSSNRSNTWSSSTLNTSTLNGTYLAGLNNNSWSSMITTHTWKVGGMSSSNGTGTPQTAYNYEVGANSSSTTYNAKIGLMYVSDYGFAASNTYWSTNLGSYNSASSNNWLYLGSHEWTISRNWDYSDHAFYVHSGLVHLGDVSSSSYAVRPVFYLNSNVQYSSGSGTSSDPVRIVI